MESKKEFGFALVLALLSGAAALAHQLMWTRRLVDVLGANADTFSKVVAFFFVGLAAGAWISTRPAGAKQNFWLLVAGAEAGVAVLALPIAFSADIAMSLRAIFGHGALLKTLLPLCLITPPAIAMGTVVPWMVRALAQRDWFESKHAGWIYGVNTLGGVAGIVAVLLYALPRLGLTGASLAAIGGNLCVGIGALALMRAKHERRGEEPQVNHQSLSPSERLLAVASGFAILGMEVILQHQFAQVTINSLFSSALILAVVLVALAAAAVLTPLLVRFAGSEARAMTFALLLSGVLCAIQPFLIIGLRGGLNILPYELKPLAYTWELAKLSAISTGPMLLAAGMTFPLLLRTVRRENDRRVGALFGWNAVGGVLGAELAQAWLAPSFGLWTSMALVGVLYAALFIAAGSGWLKAKPEVRRPLRVPTMIICVTLLGCCVWFGRALPHAGLTPSERLAAVEVGREGVVATIERGPQDWRMLFNNSYTLGGSKAQFNQERQGLLPLLIHGDPKSVAMLGVATGGSVAGAALHPGVQHVEGIELSPLVLKHAERFFAPYNRNAFRDPRLKSIQEDARWVIASRTGSYDVIVGDLFLPWRTGEGRLFALEHFENVRRSLKPRGLFCQWLPMFQLTRPQFETIARTFQRVFPDAFLVRGDFYSELPIIGLVGGRDLAELDWSAMESTCSELRSLGMVTDPLVRHAEGIAMLLIGKLPMPAKGPINTLGNAWLEWNAGRNILGMETPWFIGVPYAAYVRDVHRTAGPFLPVDYRAAHDAGQFFLTLEIAAKLKLPDFSNLHAQATGRTPAALRQDRQADWRQWPMRVKPDFWTGG